MDYLVALAELGLRQIQSLNVDQWAGKILAENYNYRAALDWFFGDDARPTQVEAGPRLVYALVTLLVPTSQEAHAWCQWALAWCERHPEITDQVYAALLGLASRIRAEYDLPAGVAGLKRAVEISRRLSLDDNLLLMRNLSELGYLLAEQGAVEQAKAVFDEAEAILSATGLDHLTLGEFQLHQAEFWNVKARLANLQGRYSDAKQHAAQSIELQRANPQNWAGSGGHIEVGQACLALKEYDEARGHFLEAFQFAVQVDALPQQAYTKRCLGLLDLRQGNLEGAQENCRASLQLAREGVDRDLIGKSLGLAAEIAIHLDQPLRAAALSGAAQALVASAGRPTSDSVSLDSLLPGWRSTLNCEAVGAAYEAGRALNPDQAIAFGLSTAATLEVQLNAADF